MLVVIEFTAVLLQSRRHIDSVSCNALFMSLFLLPQIFLPQVRLAYVQVRTNLPSLKSAIFFYDFENQSPSIPSH